MSLASLGEPAQRSEESTVGRPQSEQHFCKDDIVTDKPEKAKEEDGGKNGTLEHVGENKQKKKSTHGRRWKAQEMNDKQVTQADETAPASTCLVKRSLRRRSRLKQQKCAGEVQRNRDKDKGPEVQRGSGPFFFFGGGNGSSIIIPYCESKGWQRIYDKTREDFRLKWCELKAPRTYHSFREGEQLVYQIPNNKILTTKIGLLNSLREYDRVSSRVNHGLRRMKIEKFFPETFRMDVKDERESFFAQQEGLHVGKSNMWICKPTGLNQGRGIFLLRNLEDIMAFKARVQNVEDSINNKNIPFCVPQAEIVQRYIKNPLLLKGKKFDVRSYFLIACTSPYMVFFRHGYVRLTCDLYDPSSYNLSAHLTNQYVQKKNPLYNTLKEETVWSMERFNAYVNEKFIEPKGLPKDWVLSVFATQMQQIMIHCFLAVKAKLERKLGYFDLIGCDFLIDEDFKVWLLEMNCNPALHTNCDVLKDVVPKTVTETLDLALEIFNKCRCGMKLLPLSSQRDFLLLYCGHSISIPFAKLDRSTGGHLRTVHPKNSSTPKKRHSATLEPNGDDLANQSKDSKTMTNQKPFLLANSSSMESSSSSFMEAVEPGQNSMNGEFTTPIVIKTSEMPVNHNVIVSVCPSLSHSSTSLVPTSSDIRAISYSQQPSKSQSTQASGKTPLTQKDCSAKPAERMSRSSKATLGRVQLHLNKVTWQQPELTSDPRMQPKSARAKTTIASLSSPALTEGSNINPGLRALANKDEQSVYFRPKEFDLAQSLSCQPLRSVKLEPATNAEKRSPEKTDRHTGHVM